MMEHKDVVGVGLAAAMRAPIAGLTPNWLCWRGDDTGFRCAIGWLDA